MWLWLAAGCGQMYGSPGQPAGQPAPSGGGGPPGETSDPAPVGTSAAPAGGNTAKLPGVAKAIVDAHNRYRAKHCAPPLTWSPTLAEVAQQWANTLRDKGCAFDHSRGKYGENLAMGTSGALDGGSVVTMWYDEIKGYSFEQPGFSMQTGHFTQVVWRGTSQVGCAMTTCRSMDIWVCEYDPPGNWEGQYREHVLRTGCK
jgi:uncharacterized protein YkwD